MRQRWDFLKISIFITLARRWVRGSNLHQTASKVMSDMLPKFFGLSFPLDEVIAAKPDFEAFWDNRGDMVYELHNNSPSSQNCCQHAGFSLFWAHLGQNGPFWGFWSLFGDPAGAFRAQISRWVPATVCVLSFWWCINHSGPSQMWRGLEKKIEEFILFRVTGAWRDENG